MMNKHFSLLISGKVQGVFFRASTKEKADELGVKGFVRNEPDGSVYIEAEAEESNLKNFASWCATGPRPARVEKIEIKEGALKGFNEFVISR